MGIGIDIVEIDKIGNLINKWGDKFLTRIFSDRELKEWVMRGRRLSLLAGKFATKEAFFKANNTSLRWKEIEVIGSAFGQPIICVNGQKVDAKLSIAHTKQVAVSIVIIE